MEGLDRLGTRFADVAARLEREGVQQFAEAFDKSINNIRKNPRALMSDDPDLLVKGCRPASARRVDAAAFAVAGGSHDDA